MEESSHLEEFEDDELSVSSNKINVDCFDVELLIIATNTSPHEINETNKKKDEDRLTRSFMPTFKVMVVGINEFAI